MHRKMFGSWLVGLMAFLFISAPIEAASKEPGKDSGKLRLSAAKHFQISIEPGLHGALRREKEVLSLPLEGSFYIRSLYDETAREADLGFGSLHNPLDGSERLPLASAEKPRRLRGILAFDKYLFFLDSLRRQLLIWNEASKEWQLPADIVFDQIRPPPDRGGEAPEIEVKRVRSRLQKEYRSKSADPELLAGFSFVPAYWKDKEESQFLILSRLPHTPLLTVRCEGRHYGRCIAQRNCFVSGLKPLDFVDMQGLALVPGKKEIWIGLPRQEKILRLSAASCLDVRVIGSISIGSEMKNLSSMSFDSEGNLWITMAKPTPDLSASLFRLDAASIQKLY